MAWIIRELRRKVYDVGPEDFESGVQYAGDTIRLRCTYYDLASTLTNPTLPRISIWDSGGSLIVTSATTTATGSTGVQRYDYTIPTAGPEGVWRAQFTGKIGTVSSAYTEEFAVRITQRIWSDDLLQNYLDRHRVAIGVPTRELLRHDVSKKRYVSKFDNFEWASLYDDSLSSASEVTPDAENLVVGEWSFDTAQSGDLYLEGHSYSILLAASEALEELAGDPSRSYQWTHGSVTQKSQDPLQLAQYYRSLETGMTSVTFSRTY